MINATIVGRLGRDPETREVSGTTVCNIAVATDYGWGDNKITTWTRVAIWGKRGESLAQHFAKGDGIEVRGELYLREADNGRSYLEMRCDSWSFLPKSNAGANQGQRSTPAPAPQRQPARQQSAPAQQNTGGYGGDYDSDIPF